MKIGFYTNVFNDWPLEQALEFAAGLNITAVEFGVGGSFAKGAHCDAEKLLNNETAMREFKSLLKNYGMEISALCTHGNPVHPNAAIAAKDHGEFERACALAEALEVKNINLMSGCPGGGPRDETPNWIVAPWPDCFAKALKYQWEEVLVPYWGKAAGIARSHGVDHLAFEMHMSCSVYNVASLMKLREAVGEIISCNFDPSHLVWQGVDPYDAILALNGVISHVHAKDVFINEPYKRVNGVLSTTPASDFKHRPWFFRSVGYGGDADGVWGKIMAALSMIGYDNVISIEHEDGFMPVEDGFKKAAEYIVKYRNDSLPKTLWFDYLK